MPDNCGSCKFYIREPLRPSYGECHAKCPTLGYVQGPQGVMNIGGWPPTQEKHWCGEHKAKTNGQAQ
jgi:hypothetical protein